MNQITFFCMLEAATVEDPDRTNQNSERVTLLDWAKLRLVEHTIIIVILDGEPPMPRKSVVLAVCLVLLVTLILSKIRCVEQFDGHALQKHDSPRLVRAFTAANFTDVSSLNDTTTTPLSSKVSIPASSAPPPPPVASPPPTPTPAIPTSIPIPPTPVVSPVPVPSAPPVGVPSGTPFSNSRNSLVVPILDCVVVQSSGEYSAYFSYENEGSDQVLIPIGNDNKFSAPADDIGQPTTFSPGRSALFPASVFTAVLSQGTSWQLTSYLLAIDPQDTTVRCKEDISLVVSVTTTFPFNSSFVDVVTQVIAQQFNVSVSSVNVTILQQQNNAYEVHIVINTPSRLVEAIKTAKEIISDPDLLEEPLKQLLSPDTGVVAIRGDPTLPEREGVFDDKSMPSSASWIFSVCWPLLAIFNVVM